MEKCIDMKPFLNNSNDKLMVSELTHLKFEIKNGEHVVTLIDESEYEIIKGYGTSIAEAINDLHSNLL